jgi:hypothetical protein
VSPCGLGEPLLPRHQMQRQGQLNQKEGRTFCCCVLDRLITGQVGCVLQHRILSRLGLGNRMIRLGLGLLGEEVDDQKWFPNKRPPHARPYFISVIVG